MSEQRVRFEISERMARLTFDRPGDGNRIDVATMQGFIAALRQANDAEVDVLVIAAAGPDFSLGRDQSEKPTGMSKRDNLGLILQANELLAGFAGVTVAAIQGRALGFGSGVAVQSDITIAAEDAVMGFNEIQHGFAPAIVMTYLETYVSRKVAIDLLMSGRNVTAPEARAMGLVTRVVAENNLEAEVQSTVDDLLSKPIQALRQCKFFLRIVATVPESERGQQALDALTAGT